MLDPLLRKHTNLEKTSHKPNYLIVAAIKGSLESFILTVSIIVSIMTLNPYLETLFATGNFSALVIYLGVPIIIANAFSIPLSNCIILEEIDLRYQIKANIEDIDESYSPVEHEHWLSSTTLYVSIYILFGLMILAPYTISHYYQILDQITTILLIGFIMLMEMTAIALIKSSISKTTFLSIFLEVFIVALLSSGITFLLRLLIG